MYIYIFVCVCVCVVCVCMCVCVIILIQCSLYSKAKFILKLYTLKYLSILYVGKNFSRALILTSLLCEGLHNNYERAIFSGYLMRA